MKWPIKVFDSVYQAVCQYAREPDLPQIQPHLTSWQATIHGLEQLLPPAAVTPPPPPQPQPQITLYPQSRQMPDVRPVRVEPGHSEAVATNGSVLLSTQHASGFDSTAVNQSGPAIGSSLAGMAPFVVPKGSQQDISSGSQVSVLTEQDTDSAELWTELSFLSHVSDEPDGSSKHVDIDLLHTGGDSTNSMMLPTQADALGAHATSDGISSSISSSSLPLPQKDWFPTHMQTDSRGAFTVPLPLTTAVSDSDMVPASTPTVADIGQLFSSPVEEQDWLASGDNCSAQTGDWSMLTFHQPQTALPEPAMCHPARQHDSFILQNPCFEAGADQARHDTAILACSQHVPMVADTAVIASVPDAAARCLAASQTEPGALVIISAGGMQPAEVTDCQQTLSSPMKAISTSAEEAGCDPAAEHSDSQHVAPDEHTCVARVAADPDSHVLGVEHTDLRQGMSGPWAVSSTAADSTGSAQCAGNKGGAQAASELYSLASKLNVSLPQGEPGSPGEKIPAVHVIRQPSWTGLHHVAGGDSQDGQIGHTAPDLQGTTAAADAGTAAATPASAVTTAVATAACMNATVLSDSTPPQEAKPSANNEQAWVGGSSLIDGPRYHQPTQQPPESFPNQSSNLSSPAPAHVQIAPPLPTAVGSLATAAVTPVDDTWTDQSATADSSLWYQRAAAPITSAADVISWHDMAAAPESLTMPSAQPTACSAAESTHGTACGSQGQEPSWQDGLPTAGEELTPDMAQFGLIGQLQRQVERLTCKGQLAKQAYRAEMQLVKARHTREMDALRAQHGKESAELLGHLTRLQLQLDTSGTAHEAEEGSVESGRPSQATRAQAKALAAEHAGVVAEYDSQIGRLQEQLKAADVAKHAERAQLLGHLNTVQSRLNMAEAEQAGLGTDYDSQIGRLQEQLKAAEAAKHAERAQLLAHLNTMQSRLNVAEAELSSSTAGYHSQISSLQAQLNAAGQGSYRGELVGHLNNAQMQLHAPEITSAESQKAPFEDQGRTVQSEATAEVEHAQDFKLESLPLQLDSAKATHEHVEACHKGQVHSMQQQPCSPQQEQLRADTASESSHNILQFQLDATQQEHTSGQASWHTSQQNIEQVSGQANCQAILPASRPANVQNSGQASWHFRGHTHALQMQMDAISSQFLQKHSLWQFA